jgi:2-keto-4-pentenoate hydratase/2-oxohepta-3-ene-1,7-dioic acid hydratase in catechol pathway
MRVGAAGEEVTTAEVEYEGSTLLLDVSAYAGDITAGSVARYATSDFERYLAGNAVMLPKIERSASLRIAPPIANVGKIVCIGLNYVAHAREAGMEIPAEPVIFLKAADTVVGAFDTVLIPPTSVKTDYEVELAVVIGHTARYIRDDEDALEYVAGYTISNDVSEREYQLERGGQWDKGKNCETFNPLGPALVTRPDVPNPQNLRLVSRVNGQLRQSSSTADMIFPVEFLVRYVSQFMTLYPGDVINTGTPQGVGSGFSPPRFLDHGDIVEVAIDNLGTQTQRFERLSPSGEK